MNNNLRFFLRFIIAFSLLASIYGCVKEDEAPMQKDLHEVVFHAGWAPETKTVLQEDGNVWWSPGDEISLFIGIGDNGGYKLTSTNSEPAATVDFVGQIGDNPNNTSYIAIYPYNESNRYDGYNLFFTIPTEQIAKEGSFADKALISVAVSSDKNLLFRNLCGGIKFSVAHEGIQKIEILNRDAAHLSGSMVLNEFGKVGGYGGGCSKTITITAPNNTFEVGKYYYATVAPSEEYQSADNGIQVTYYKEDSVATAYLPGVLFKRSVFKRMLEGDKNLKFKRVYGSMARLTQNFLPDDIDKAIITEAYFHVSDSTTTGRTICDVYYADGYEPIYFEMIGTIAHFYTKGDVYKCDAVNFEGWESLRSIDLSMFDVSEAVVMSFADCRSLESLDLSSFDTGEVTCFGNMFLNCINLKSLDVTNFNTSKAVDMYRMFGNCKSLTTLDVSSFNTSSVTNFDLMFSDCSGLRHIDLGGFNTSNAISMADMSAGSAFETIDVSSFNTSNVVRAGGMFRGCWNLREIDVSNFDTGNMEWMSYMFAGCRSLDSLNLTTFNFSSVLGLDGMFQGCALLKDIKMPSSSSPNLKYLQYMFENCYSLESIDLSSLDTRNVTTLISMFKNCTSLKSLDLSSFNVDNVPSFWSVFEGCKNLEHLNISSFNPSTIADAKYMLYNTRKLTTLDLGEFDLSLSSDNNGVGHWLGELTKQCHIRCTQATKEALIAASSLLSDSKYIWYTDGSPLPDVNYENIDGLYCSTDYSMDKTVRTVQLASAGAGIDLVIMGDAYSDRLIADGTYDADMEKAINAIFAVEPYKSFKNLFNIYIVYAVSENEIIGKSTAISCFNAGSPIGSQGWVWRAYYASAARVSSPGECSPVIIMNSDISDGAATGFLTMASDYMNDPNRDDYHGGASESVAYISGPKDERFDYIVRHEFGHSFGFLMDEYSKYSSAISDYDISSWQCCFAYGMWKNVDLVSDNTVKWAKFINDSRYAGTGIGVYEGALYATGTWRSSPESIMNSTDSGFNAPSREAIYYKIHKLAYGRHWNYNFEDFVTYDMDNIEADKTRMSASNTRTKQAITVFKREPIFKKSIVTGPDGKKRIKIVMN